MRAEAEGDNPIIPIRWVSEGSQCSFAFEDLEPEPLTEMEKRQAYLDAILGGQRVEPFATIVEETKLRMDADASAIETANKMNSVYVTFTEPETVWRYVWHCANEPPQQPMQVTLDGVDVSDICTAAFAHPEPGHPVTGIVRLVEDVVWDGNGKAVSCCIDDNGDIVTKDHNGIVEWAYS